MGSLFRSEDMTLCQLYLQAEAAYDTVSQLGELGIVQFKDLTEDINSFNKKFVNEIRRCDEMERQLRYFEKMIEEEHIKIHYSENNPIAPGPKYMIDLEAQFEKNENELRELGSNIVALKQNYSGLLELQQVLKLTDSFFMESTFSFLADTSEDMAHASASQVEIDDIELENVRRVVRDLQPKPYLGYLAGVVSRDRLEPFMRMLWFACRGNVFVRHEDIPQALEDPYKGTAVFKTVFMVFFQGEQLKSRVEKICEGFKASVYPCPESPEERQEMKIGVLARIQDIDQVLISSQEQRKRILVAISQDLREWFIKVLKIKSIYHTLNMFNTEGSNYIAECWMPVEEMTTVKSVLDRATENQGINVSSIIQPIECNELPTYNKLNKFTYPYQVICDSYGIGTYKEVNPDDTNFEGRWLCIADLSAKTKALPFSIITYPFLFGVMFGDAGHGTILLLFAIFLIFKETALEKYARSSDMFGPIYYGRYIILLMGIFSIYTGVLYNDIFSKSINIFGSSWNVSIYDEATLLTNERIMLDPADPKIWNRNPYPFGVDPVWALSTNKITFQNSFKEKMSITLGVMQMVLGVSLSLFNHVYFGKTLNILCEFIPSMLFLLGIFGYLVALVFTKWIMYDASTSHCAPDLLVGFINMFLFKYPKEGDGTPCSGQLWYTGQKGFQIFLVIMCVSCAIIMLLAKPFYLRHRHKRSKLIIAVTGVTDFDQENFHSDKEQIIPRVETESEDFDFGDVMINQAIHTIEFCLGCISHTASYLRLWALSLAHSQLSEVLWLMLLRMGLKVNSYWGFVAITVLFAGWALGTVAILLCMEGLSAFLHTLRLHWVEFQSKFFKGEGFAFIPLNFHELLLDIPGNY